MIAIGIPICAKQSYVLDKLIKNQEQIKAATPQPTIIIFATEEFEFAVRLKKQLATTQLDYRIIFFIPDSGKYYKLANITAAREAIRHTCMELDADYLLFVDADILLDPNVLNVLLAQKQDVVYNSYLVHIKQVCNNGLGTCLISQKVLGMVRFRHLIPSENPILLYKYNTFIDECLYFELDALHAGFRIKQGTFVSSCHYSSGSKFNRLNPSPRTRWEKIVHSRLARRILAVFVNITPVLLLFSVIGFWIHINLRQPKHSVSI